VFFRVLRVGLIKTLSFDSCDLLPCVPLLPAPGLVYHCAQHSCNVRVWSSVVGHTRWSYARSPSGFACQTLQLVCVCVCVCVRVCGAVVSSTTAQVDLLPPIAPPEPVADDDDAGVEETKGEEEAGAAASPKPRALPAVLPSTGPAPTPARSALLCLCSPCVCTRTHP
jgi:hypothetical protein